MPNKKQYLIYGLVDPRSFLVRYIGKSSTGLRRPRRHLKAASTQTTHRACWIRQLIEQGLSYEIVVLETHVDQTTLCDAERWWIAYGRGCGWPLTNHTDGGDGRSGNKHSASSLAKISAASKRTWSEPGRREAAAERWRGEKNVAKRPEVGVLLSERSWMKTPEAKVRMSGEHHPQKRPEARERQSLASRAMSRESRERTTAGVRAFYRDPANRAQVLEGVERMRLGKLAKRGAQ